MPITLGCPSCGKRFRARDESAGKKVKCPYCQAAVQVPTADESASAGAPTAPLPPPDSAPVPVPGPRSLPPSRPAPPPRPSTPPAAPVVASPDDWGALPTAPARPSAPPPAAPPPPSTLPLEPEPAFPPMSPGRGGRDRPKPAKADKPEKPAKEKPKAKSGDESPEEVLAGGWRSVRSGLFWVQFALLWLSLVGCIGFGKAVYTRSVGELPKGEGTDWVSIEGYVNASGPNAVPLSKTDLVNLALYGLPVAFAGICIVFGRLIASGAPWISGARGLFALSALFALIGVPALFGAFIFESGELYQPRLMLKDEFQYAWTAFLLLVPLAEFWFLTALAASGVALQRPKTARAVGAVAFVYALGAFVVMLGWELYRKNGRPKAPDADVLLYEQAALMVGWLLLMLVYSRAVRNVRVAAREYIDTVEGG